MISIGTSYSYMYKYLNTYTFVYIYILFDNTICSWNLVVSHLHVDNKKPTALHYKVISSNKLPDPQLKVRNLNGMQQESYSDCLPLLSGTAGFYWGSKWSMIIFLHSFSSEILFGLSTKMYFHFVHCVKLNIYRELVFIMLLEIPSTG